MAGWQTNGLPIVTAPSLNGVLTTAPQGTYTNLTQGALVAVDTEVIAGVAPQTVAATAFQIASTIAGAILVNTTTSTVHAATLNTVSGSIVTEALTTAAGSTYTFTLTNSLLVSGAAPPWVSVVFGTCTAGALVVTSVTNATGSTVIVFTNTGTVALNGTIVILFHLNSGNL